VELGKAAWTDCKIRLGLVRYLSPLPSRSSTVSFLSSQIHPRPSPTTRPSPPFPSCGLPGPQSVRVDASWCLERSWICTVKMGLMQRHEPDTWGMSRSFACPIYVSLESAIVSFDPDLGAALPFLGVRRRHGAVADW